MWSQCDLNPYLCFSVFHFTNYFKWLEIITLLVLPLFLSSNRPVHLSRVYAKFPLLLLHLECQSGRAPGSKCLEKGLERSTRVKTLAWQVANLNSILCVIPECRALTQPGVAPNKNKVFRKILKFYLSNYKEQKTEGLFKSSFPFQVYTFKIGCQTVIHYHKLDPVQCQKQKAYC